MNKKGESSATQMVFLLVISLSILSTFSILVIELSDNYGVTSPSEFEDFKEYYLTLNETTDDIIGSQNTGDEKVNVTWYNPITWVTAAKDIAQEAWESSLLRRGWATLKIIPQSLSFATKSMTKGFSNLALDIPPPIIWMLFTVVSLSVIFVVVKAIWEKRI